MRGTPLATTWQAVERRQSGRFRLEVVTVALVAAVAAGSLACWDSGSVGSPSGSPNGERQSELIQLAEQRWLMGTDVSIAVRVSEARRAEAGESLQRAFEAIERIDDLMSTYDIGSELMKLNSLGAEMSVTLSPETFECLERARHWTAATAGAFDPAAGGLLRLWRRAAREGAEPTAESIEAARGLVGLDAFELSEETATGRLRQKGAFLDLGGIAKGYAIDAAVAVLREAGITSALVDAGGDLYALGARDEHGGPWRLGVRDPREGPSDRHDHRQPIAVVALTEGSLCSSGDYERGFVVGERRYSHIIDPRSGRPVEAAANVSVLAPRAVDADALATALSVLGPEAGLALIDGLEGTAALYVARGEGGELVAHASRAWADVVISGLGSERR